MHLKPFIQVLLQRRTTRIDRGEHPLIRSPRYPSGRSASPSVDHNADESEQNRLTRLHWALEGRGVWDRRSRQVTRYAVDVRVAELVRLVQARRCQDVRLVRARDKDSWGVDFPLHWASKAVYSCSSAPRVVQMRLIRTFVIPSFLGCYECRTCGIRPGASPAWCGRQCSGHFRFDTTLASTAATSFQELYRLTQLRASIRPGQSL